VTEAVLSLGFSPCPNDTFLFHALVHGAVSLPGIRLESQLADVETLNRWALSGKLDVSKVSYGALPFLLDRYALLRSGGALGRGCGPLLVARRPLTATALRSGRVAIPGRHTTANLLFRLYEPRAAPGIEVRYEEIMPAVAAGAFDAGLIIHESRFTFPDHGLVRVVDLGEWWEEETGAPIPLGGIVARRSLGSTASRVDDAIRSSVEAAFRDPDASRTYVRRHAQELSESVMRSHIELYVNDYSLDPGADGERAAEELVRRARAAHLVPPGQADLFHERTTT